VARDRISIVAVSTGPPGQGNSAQPNSTALPARDLALPRFRGHLTLWGLLPQRSLDAEPEAPAYPLEFRAEAVRLARACHTIEGVARDLGVARESVRRWAKQAEIKCWTS
jgi:ribosomal protein S14